MKNNEYNEIFDIEIDKSMIRKIGENEFLKIIPNEKVIQISTIKQSKITEPITQEDTTIIEAYPKRVIVYRNNSQDNQYETTWKTESNKVLEIPQNNIKSIYQTLKDHDLIKIDNMLNLSNTLGMIVKQHSIEEKIESIKETI